MQTIPLEDTFGDITGKASAGRGLDVSHLAQATGIERSRLESFMADKAQPSEAEAHAVARALKLDPAKLADSGLVHWHPQAFTMPSWLRHQINAPYPSNGYLVIDTVAGVGAVVDPAGKPKPIVDAVRNAGVELAYILVTHKHRDHADALAEVRRAFPKALPVIHELDAPEVGAAARDARGIRDGDRLPFGDGAIELLHTPGHTDGSSCFLYRGTIFTGDELFAGSIGRVFGPHMGYAEQLDSIRSKIFSLPGDAVVLPGHGPASTVAQEQAHNPFF